ncbi:MAG TPA: hypothetical protein VH475_03435 [Tepidisphaeraceae bacterium]|jgi:hypothetical protein
MRRFAVVLSVGVTCVLSGLLCAAEPPGSSDVDVYRDAYYLFDPYAASGEKSEACNRLAERGQAGRGAIVALMRQTRYDQPGVREAAERALSRVLTAGEWDALHGGAALSGAGLDRFSDDFLDGVLGWEAAPALELLLASENEDLRRVAIRGIARLPWRDEALSRASPFVRARLADLLEKTVRTRAIDDASRKSVTLAIDRLGRAEGLAAREPVRPAWVPKTYGQPVAMRRFGRGAAAGAAPAMFEPVVAPRTAAMAVIRVVPWYAPGSMAVISQLWRERDARVRADVANALGTPEARAMATMADVLADLRAPDPMTRSAAARRLESLDVAPPELTEALIRAVDARDLASREGLLIGIERAYFESADAITILRTLAASEGDPARRAYARAALREVRNGAKERP